MSINRPQTSRSAYSISDEALRLFQAGSLERFPEDHPQRGHLNSQSLVAFLEDPKYWSYHVIPHWLNHGSRRCTSPAPTSQLYLTQLTFGVESECLVGYKESKFPTEDHLTEALVEILQDIVPVVAWNAQPEARQRNWTVTWDGSIREDDSWLPSRYASTGREFVSRALSNAVDGAKEVERVPEAITEKFKLKVNQSTGLHIHVGDGNRGFSHDHVQRFLLLVIAFEHLVNNLVPSHRLVHNSCVRPLSQLQRFKDTSLRERLAMIKACHNIEMLGTLLESRA